MKKMSKAVSLIMLALMITACLAACETLNQEDADWIQTGYTYNSVVRQLGKPDDSLPQQNAYYWFDGASSIKDANAKLDNGKTVKVIAVLFDENNRATRVQFAELNDENKHILTEAIIVTNLNLTQKRIEKVSKGDSYYDVIDFFGLENSSYDYGDSKYCYWYDGAANIDEAMQKELNGESFTTLEIQFDSNNTVYILELREA